MSMMTLFDVDAWPIVDWSARHIHQLSLLHLDTRGNFKDGPLQDVHWPEALFGYFPCYTLGAMYAAQWFATMRAQNPFGAKSRLMRWRLMGCGGTSAPIAIFKVSSRTSLFRAAFVLGNLRRRSLIRAMTMNGTATLKLF